MECHLKRFVDSLILASSNTNKGQILLIRTTHLQPNPFSYIVIFKKKNSTELIFTIYMSYQLILYLVKAGEVSVVPQQDVSLQNVLVVRVDPRTNTALWRFMETNING